MENQVTESKQRHGMSRRSFMSGFGTGIMIVGSNVLGGKAHAAPTDKLNIAGIGIGGVGKNNIRALAQQENIVALCDVDQEYAAPVFELYPNARKWTDYRRMLDEQKDIDAVMIATPDHTHAVIAMAAMERGKHVYLQKPLTRLVSEARILTEAARKYKVMTQMGNQGHSGDGVRSVTEWIAADVIGEVREVHAWTNRPVWPQGMAKPKESMAWPDTLDWDLWLGPATLRPYHPIYLPFGWRAWWVSVAAHLGIWPAMCSIRCSQD